METACFYFWNVQSNFWTINCVMTLKLFLSIKVFPWNASRFLILRCPCICDYSLTPWSITLSWQHAWMLFFNSDNYFLTVFRCWSNCGAIAVGGEPMVLRLECSECLGRTWVLKDNRVQRLQHCINQEWCKINLNLITSFYRKSAITVVGKGKIFAFNNVRFYVTFRLKFWFWRGNI